MPAEVSGHLEPSASSRSRTDHSSGLCFDLRGDAHRFGRSRQVGAYLGLTPRQDQSGNRDPQLRITKAGDRFVRKLLVGSTEYILGPFGSDCDLRGYGERIAFREGKSAKKRAVVAVARQLSVLLHHLWVTGETYEPLYNSEEYLEGAA